MQLSPSFLVDNSQCQGTSTSSIPTDWVYSSCNVLDYHKIHGLSNLHSIGPDGQDFIAKAPLTVVTMFAINEGAIAPFIS